MNTTISVTIKTRHVYVLAACILVLPLTFGVYKAFADPPTGSPVPRTFSYDGTLEHQGQPATGTFDFRFQLVDKDGISGGTVSTYWPENGLEAERSLNVVNGKFTVTFPDITANPGEGPLPDAVFETPNLYLRIAVAPDGQSPILLKPFPKINSAPFAVRAEKAEISNISALSSNSDSMGNINWNIWESRILLRTAFSMCRTVTGRPTGRAYQIPTFSYPSTVCNNQGLTCYGRVYTGLTSNNSGAWSSDTDTGCGAPVGADSGWFACCNY